MVYLLLNIVCASTFLLCIKWVQNRRREDVITVGAINYVVAAIAICPKFFQQHPETFTSEAALIGGTMGACYFIAFFFANFAIKWIGAASATVISGLSLSVPIVFGVAIWNESPNLIQIAGVVLALFSLSMIGGKLKTRKPGAVDVTESSPLPKLTPLILIVFFFLCGAARLAQAAYKHVCDGEPSSHFSLAAFVVAAIPSLILLIGRQKRISATEWAFGIVMGLANLAQTELIILALEIFAKFIVFPVTSAGGLVLTVLVATRLLGESLSRKTYFGIAIACLALVFLNWWNEPHSTRSLLLVWQSIRPG